MLQKKQALRKVKVYVKGPGNGRESAIRSIHNAAVLKLQKLLMLLQFLTMDVDLQKEEEFNNILSIIE
jgi:hypothetical protein